MGSQTLEILRQGVWASLTGGWFYDPHQNVFCNAVHLYIWLFLLCMPFITYLYFTTYITWSIYCVMIAILTTILKILNLAFHSMYDKAQAMSDVNLKSSSKVLRETSGDDDAGIEMQVLGSSEMPSRTSIENHSDEISCANSAVSNYFQEPVSSTIVDVHRKNSSESSDSIGIYPSISLQTSITTHNADICNTTSNHRRQISSTKSENLDTNVHELREVIHESSSSNSCKEKSISNENNTLSNYSQNSASIDSGITLRKSLSNRHESIERDEIKKRNKLLRQISLDAEKMPTTESSSKLQRHRSSDDQEDHQRHKNKSNVSLILPHHHHHHHHHHSSNQNNHSRLQSLASDLYLENNYTTKSELAIENIPNDLNNKNYLNQKSTPMRRDSNSTMSALQLPTMASSSSSRLRRHSNTSGKPLSNSTSVRRIKSAALEVCCAPPSVSNLTPHPNSIEAIGGQILRNPQHTVLPPPSKTLSRNPHLNLFPKPGGSSLISNNNLNSLVDHVYPIEELADEGGGTSGRSLSDEFTLNQNSDSDDDDDDDGDEDSRETHSNNPNQRQSITESESDLDRLQLQSTDSDTENNGSRSPLLEIRNRTTLFSAEKATGSTSESKSKSNTEIVDKKLKSDKINLPSTSGTSEKLSGAKSEESEGPSSDGEQASAGSKDMLLSEKENGQYITFEVSGMKEQSDFNITIVANKERTFTAFRSDSPINVEGIPPRSLGAIPKSRSRSSPPRRFLPDDHWRPTRNIALPTRQSDRCPQTPTPSILTFLNSRPDHPISNYHQIAPIYPSTSQNTSEFQLRSFSASRPRSYAVLEPHRLRRPKIRRSTRSKHRREPIDSENLSKEDNDTNNQRVTECLPSFEKIAKRSIDNSLSLERFIEGTLNYDLQPNSTDRCPVQLLSISRVDFNETSFPDFCRHYIANEKPTQTKRCYIFPLNWFGKKSNIKISMDRLQLLALFDRDNGWIQVILAIILSTLVSVLGSLVLHKGFYDDIFAFIFCFVIAGSQYSLLKSVQPDAASPIHGFNKTVAFSRPIYFCICSGLLLLANYMTETMPTDGRLNPFEIFGFHFLQKEILSTMEYVLTAMLLLFPIFFSLGLFPQISTFLMYLIEQIDMHIFGGNAVCSLLSAFISLIRSLLACGLLYGAAFGGLSEKKGTQHVLFSIFCALLIPVCYHLSRSASDISCVWNLIKSSLIYQHDEDDVDISENNCKNSKIKEKSSQNDEENKDEDKDGGECSQHKKNSIQNSTNNNNDDTCYDSVTHEISNNNNNSSNNNETELIDPLPKKLQATVNNRLKNDLLICTVLGIIIMSLHSSTVFTVLQPDLNFVLYALAITFGVLLHYVIPQMRKHLPWLCISRPLLRQHEHGQFEAKEASKVMWFENTYIILCFLERNVLYPLIFLSALTADSMNIVNKYGVSYGALIVVICGLKCIRSSYSDPSTQYLILTFAFLFFCFDFKTSSETFLIDYFFVAIIFKKTSEFLLKMQFVVTYIAPWQITWGSAFHAFAQPFSVPHSAMLFLQAAISAILSTPLNPFLGSAIFLTSYVRPIKFWERDYNTKRIDHSNTRLSSQLERDLGADDNNLNSIFYEHLTRSLQHSLCGDLLLGRWGNVSQGDCFVLASDYLNCLVHIIELGNGLCTFQMRGLEFRGTYCQQREVEAISEGVEDNDGCCCCSPGHLPRMLSANAMFSTRWLAWQVIAAQYVLEGYSISDNSAVATLQVFEFRKVLITYYVKSIIYYIVRSPKLQEWLSSRTIQDSLQSTMDKQFVDLDPIFNHNLDDDFDFRASGVTRNSFCAVYLDWIQYCGAKRQEQHQQSPPINVNNNNSNSINNNNANSNNNNMANIGNSASPTTPRSSSNPTPSPRDNNQNIRNRNSAKSMRTNNEAENTQPPNNQTHTLNMARDSPLVSLCLALALLGRRTLATASHSSSSGVEFFLHGLHALFKGDFRITSHRDEWVFADMELLHGVVAPAVRMSLKLHQDHFLSPDEYEDPDALYEAIDSHTQELVISHEADPLWRNAVLRGAPNLLALRHVMEDGSDEYRVIRLTKRFLSFRVIKLNRECVRGLWAGQQQELIYLRNRNPERGSIQNAKQALRNIINSSCDQPIGYPIYVSPLTTSYAETNEQLSRIIGGAITLEMLRNIILEFWNRIRKRCREGCSSGSGMENDLGEIQGVYCNAQTPNNTLSGTTGTLSYGSQNISITGTGIRGSLASMSKPTSSNLIAGFLNRDVNREGEHESIRERGTAKRYTNRADRERRATLPVSNRDKDNGSQKQTSASTNSSVKLQESVESCNISPNQKSNNSSFVNLNVTNNYNSNKVSTGNSNLIIDKSSERIVAVDESEELQSYILVPSPNQAQSSNIELDRIVRIYDVDEIYDCLDLGRRIDVIWPNEEMRSKGGRSSWKKWTPRSGMFGKVVHYWQPNHTDRHFRSNVNRTILLVKIGDHYVPIGEKGIKMLINISDSDKKKVDEGEDLYTDDEEYDDEEDDHKCDLENCENDEEEDANNGDIDKINDNNLSQINNKTEEENNDEQNERIESSNCDNQWNEYYDYRNSQLRLPSVNKSSNNSISNQNTKEDE